MSHLIHRAYLRLNLHFSPGAEEGCTVSERGCVADQPQHWRGTMLLRLVEDDTAALR